MAKQLSFNLTKVGRTARGRIKKGFRLSACTGRVTKAKPKKSRKRKG
jgi:hypothetical protein